MLPSYSRARLVLPLAAIAALFTLGLGFAAVPQAGASSTPGSVIFTPTSGPVGTVVQVFVHQPLTETTPVNYALGFTLTDPAGGGCAAQQPFPGVAPFGSSEANGSATFNWPASLNQGPYWLCATPTSGGGKAVYSSVPYTVTAGTVPTATATAPASTTSGAILAHVPASGIAVGTTFTLTVRHWVSPLGTPPERVLLTARDPSLPPADGGAEINAAFTTAPGPSAGDYNLTVIVPEHLPSVPATYWAHVMDQAGGAYSLQFTIIAAATPVPVASPNPTTMGSVSFPLLLVPIITSLICIAVLLLTRALLRRRGAVPAQSGYTRQRPPGGPTH